jgi:hypothetical protein
MKHAPSGQNNYLDQNYHVQAYHGFVSFRASTNATQPPTTKNPFFRQFVRYETISREVFFKLSTKYMKAHDHNHYLLNALEKKIVSENQWVLLTFSPKTNGPQKI